MRSHTHFHCDSRQRLDPSSPMHFAIKPGLVWRLFWAQPARHFGVLEGKGWGELLQTQGPMSGGAGR